MVTELPIAARVAKAKGDLKRLRREGKIPCVLYTGRGATECATVSKDDFDSIVRHLKQGFLPTTVFQLKDEQGKARKAILKEVQYDVTTYNVTHLDFQILEENRKVGIKVPVECKNQTECLGVKMGGFLRPVMRHVPVRCLPRDIPSHFELDVKMLDIGKALRVKDIAMSEKIVPQVRANEIVISVVKSAST